MKNQILWKCLKLCGLIIKSHACMLCNSEKERERGKRKQVCDKFVCMTEYGKEVKIIDGVESDKKDVYGRVSNSMKQQQQQHLGFRKT